MSTKRFWLSFMTLFLMISAITGRVGYELGYAAYRETDDKQISAALADKEKHVLMVVVRYSRDVRAGTTIAWSDMTEERCEAVVYPTDGLESPYIGFGRKLRSNKSKGALLTVRDFEIEPTTNSKL